MTGRRAQVCAGGKDGFYLRILPDLADCLFHGPQADPCNHGFFRLPERADTQGRYAVFFQEAAECVGDFLHIGRDDGDP